MEAAFAAMFVLFPQPRSVERMAGYSHRCDILPFLDTRYVPIPGLHKPTVYSIQPRYISEAVARLFPGKIFALQHELEDGGWIRWLQFQNYAAISSSADFLD